MAFINKHDTNGTKGLLAKGELGYDDYAAGGDTGRVYVGTGTENIALAERLESNMMTKAQFNALAEERKANRAGSGWDEWGKHAVSTNNYPNINEGMFVSVLNSVSYNGNIKLGYTGADNTGVSKTNYPIAKVNGIRHRVDNGTASNNITLPTAPTIYPHDTVLTAEQINSGVIKHADASNSGLIVNGKFDTDTSGWANFLGTLTKTSEGVLVTSAGSERIGGYTTFPTVVGKSYKIEFLCKIGTTEPRLRVGNSINSTGIINAVIFNVSGFTRIEYNFVATSNTTFISLCVNSDTAGSIAYFNNIAVYPTDAISRSDLVFLESYHEDISEKNFVYPLGNVQYLGSNTDNLTGIANGAFTGFETYSLFGTWQTPSALIGKGYVWSSLTEAQKRAFIANPENNCYLDGDKVIQVRYRVRVVQGLGDSWYNVDTQLIGAYNYMIYTSTSNYVLPKGALSSISNDLGEGGGNGIGLYAGAVNTAIATLSERITGTFDAVRISAAAAYEGKCYALPIALTSRRNQGMWHKVFNPNGTKLASDGLDCFRTTISFTSTMDCFNPAKLLTASGYIGSVSGRPDRLFYDQVHEGDIQDLRNSSKKVEDYNRLISREFNKLVAGTHRGKEGERFIERFGKLKLQATSYNVYGSTAVRLEGVPNNYIFDNTTSVSYGNSTYFEHIGFIKGNTKYYKVGYISSASTSIVYLSPEYGNVVSDFTTSVEYDVIACPKSTRTKSNTLLHCDIIGNPTNYPTAWKQSGVFGTPLIVAEDGTSLLPNGTLDTFKLSRKANATPLLCLRSTDNGATWTSFTPTFNTTTNAITLTDEPAANLVLVYYQTHTSMAVPAVNSEVLEIGDVFASNYSPYSIINSLINKVPTNSGGNSGNTPRQFLGKPTNYGIENSSRAMITPDGYRDIPQNKAVSITPSTSPACKVFPYLTRLNGKAYLNLVFKEMKHNGTSWGDDAKFNIVDNVSTTTDNNAQTVLIGQKTVELPYFIGADE